MNIIFIHPENIGRTTSGSGVRPIEMRKAFKQKAKHFFEITGPGRQKFISFLAILNFISQGNKIDFVYFENLSRPHVLKYKVLFGRRFPIPSLSYFCFLIVLKLLGIPVFYFFRDAHWNHRDLYPSHFSKKAFYTLKIFGNLEVLMLKASKFLVCYPNEKFCQYMMDNFGLYGFALPPKGSKQFEKYVKKPKINLFYVGGCTGMYHPRILFDSIRYLEEKYNIVFCTRKKDWHTIEETLDVPDNVKIIHANGKELNQWFKWADIGLCLMPPSKYVNMAFSVKVGEYLSAGLPVISFKNTYVGSYVSNFQIGWAVNDSKGALTEFLRNLPSEDILYRNLKISRNIQEYHWKHNFSVLTSRVPTKHEVRTTRMIRLATSIQIRLFLGIVYKSCFRLSNIPIAQKYYLKIFKRFRPMFTEQELAELLDNLKLRHYHTYFDSILLIPEKLIEINPYDIFKLSKKHEKIDYKRLENQMRRLICKQHSLKGMNFQHNILFKLSKQIKNQNLEWPSFFKTCLDISFDNKHKRFRLMYERELKRIAPAQFIFAQFGFIQENSALGAKVFPDLIEELELIEEDPILRIRFMNAVETYGLDNVFINTISKGKFLTLKSIMRKTPFSARIFNNQFFSNEIILSNSSLAGELIKLSDEAFYACLAIIKTIDQIGSEIWYREFKMIFNSKMQPTKVKRRFASYLIHHKKRTKRSLDIIEVELIQQVLQSGSLDKKDLEYLKHLEYRQSQSINTYEFTGEDELKTATNNRPQLLQ